MTTALAMIALSIFAADAAAGAGAGPAAGTGKVTAADKAVQKPVKTLIGAVRYSKDALALKHVDGVAQGEFLLGDKWATGSDAQRAEFAALFPELFGAVAFPRIRGDFEHLETILYDRPKVSGDRAELSSTLVILHPAKKQELKATYALRRHGKAWRVVDVTVAPSPSMLTTLRDDQVGPIFAEGGWDKLLELLRARAAEAGVQAK